MCGIAGTLGPPRQGAVDPLAAALHRMAARGPDGEGRATARLGPHALEVGVRRLAQVDVPHGVQPVVLPSGSLLAWNGEVYNHEALRRRLAQRGVRLATRGDGEVLAALLEHEGLAGLAHVEGSYAFAFLRVPGGPLWLGRDPRGVRPLVVHATAQGVCFASTLEGLRPLLPEAPAPDLLALADVLRDGVVSGQRTALAGVRRVAPGTVLEVDARLTLRELALPAPVLEAGEPPRAPGDVLGALRLAVRDRLVLERPGAVLLSGGVDSALVAALAAEVRPLKAWTLSFPRHAPFDESVRATQTAARLRLEHELVPCPLDPTAWVVGTAEAFDEPFADASAVATWGLARAVGASARVALTGTGGDEAFGGYRRYWLLGAGPWLRRVPAFLREPMRRVLGRTAPQGARVLAASGDAQGFYRGLLRLQHEGEVRALMGPVLAGLPAPGPAPGPSSAAEAMADDLAHYLPDDLLVKEDRALMAFGVEGRHPFLDRRVLAAAAEVEHRGTPGRGRQKQLLRAYVKEVIDPDLAREPKRGFAFPVDMLYRTGLRPLAEEMLLGRRTRERGLVAQEVAQALLREHAAGTRPLGAVIHACVMLELWCRRVLDGLSSGIAGA